MKDVFLGIGTNLGDRENNLIKAVAGIAENIGTVVKSSSVYETGPWGFHSAEEFLNMVVKVRTDLNPSEVLRRILKVESLLGRKRGEKKYSSRVIDIDLLLYEDMVIDEKNLKIPHQLMHKRNFVLIPLCEIEPELIHPLLNKTFTELLESCEDKGQVRKTAGL
jgi:2-amino-4-hydroxy-6-hydroxymethyldihydropteridine diphosphokinase